MAPRHRIDRLPNGKSDVNNNGPFSTDYLGGSYHYPDASYAERDRIRRAVREIARPLRSVADS